MITDYFNKTGIDFINDKGCKEDKEIGVFRLMDGKYVVVEAYNAWRAAAAINSPECIKVEHKLIYKPVGVKPVTEERTLDSVTKKFIDKVGEENVISVAV